MPSTHSRFKAHGSPRKLFRELLCQKGAAKPLDGLCKLSVELSIFNFISTLSRRRQHRMRSRRPGRFALPGNSRRHGAGHLLGQVVRIVFYPASSGDEPAILHRVRLAPGQRWTDTRLRVKYHLYKDVVDTFYWDSRLYPEHFQTVRRPHIPSQHARA